MGASRMLPATTRGRRLCPGKEVVVGGFRRILVGWDGSRDAEHALRAAAHLASELGAELVVLGVLKRQRHVEALDEAEEDVADRRRRVVGEIAAFARRAGVPWSESSRGETIVADDVATALEEYARRHGFDVLVVGRHGLDRALHPRIGRVTEHEVRRSPCPVLVVGAD